jgi:hypothetical protein
LTAVGFWDRQGGVDVSDGDKLPYLRIAALPVLAALIGGTAHAVGGGSWFFGALIYGCLGVIVALIVGFNYARRHHGR